MILFNDNESTKGLREMVAAKYTAAEAIMSTATNQNRDLNDREKSQVDLLIGNSTTGISGEVAELEHRLKEAEGREASTKAAILADMAKDRRPDTPSAVAVGLDYPGTQQPQYVDRGGRPVDVLAKGDRIVDLPRFRGSPVPVDELNLGRWIVASATNSWNKAPAERRFMDAMSEGVNTAGGYLVPEQLMATFVDAARARSIMIQAGVTTFTMGSETSIFARLITDPVFEVVGEGTAFSGTDPTFDQVEFTATKFGNYVKISNELLQDGQNVADIVTQALTKSWAAEFDRLIIQGNGGSEGVLGLLNDPNINSTTVGGAATWESVAGGVEAIQTRDFEPTGWIVHPTIAHDLSVLTTGDGTNSAKNWLGPPPHVAPLTKLVSTNVPITDIVIGDFSKVAVGMRLDSEIFISRERFMAENQTAIRIVTRFDSQRLQVNALHSLTGITT